MVFNCPKHELWRHACCSQFVDNIMSVGYVNRMGKLQKTMDFCGSRISALPQALFQRRRVEVYLYFHARSFLEDAIEKTVGCTSRNCNSCLAVTYPI